MDEKNEYKQSKNSNISDDDAINLELLNSQLLAQLLFLCSDYLAYIATNEDIELINSKYNGSKFSYNPDIPALESAYLALAAKFIITDVGFSRYSFLYSKYVNGKIKYSLLPNIYINIGNTLGLFANYYLLLGVEGIYKRNLENPIFGV